MYVSREHSQPTPSYMQNSRILSERMSAKGATCFFHHRSACMSICNILRPISLNCRTHAYSPHECRRRAQRVSFITDQHACQSATFSDRSVLIAELTHTPHTNVGEGRNVILSSQVGMHVNLQHSPTDQSYLQNSRILPTRMSAKGATCFFHHRSACMSICNILRPISLTCRTHAYSPHECRRRAQRVSFITDQHVCQSATFSDRSVLIAELTHTPHTNVGEGRNVFHSSQVSMYVNLQHSPTDQSSTQI